MVRRVALGFVPLLLASLGGCSSADTPTTPAATKPPVVEPPKPEVKAPELGTGDHSPESVTLTEIAGASAGLKTPRDLAFNTLRPDELWVLNFADESVTIVHDASADSRTTERRKDGYAAHFMPFPAAISFGQDATTIGKPGTFATCGESRNTYDDKQPANDFMGPTLWSSDLTIFAMKNPNGLGSHLDMLHNTPLCMGIAHESANRYWVFGGLNSSIDRYDFNRDDGIGQDDHSDGQSFQYVTGQVKYLKGVPSHLFYHASDAMLYVADTGNARVAKLDTTTGTQGMKIVPKEPMGTAVVMTGATLTDVVPAGGALLKPSGLEIQNEYLYVSDNENSRVTAFTLDGQEVNHLDTGLAPGSLSGMAFGPDKKLYLVDMLGNRVLRVDTK